MNPIQAIKSSMLNAFDFSGRAPRSEFWWFLLFLSLLYALLLNIFDQPPARDGFSVRFGFEFSLNPNSSWWSNIFSAVFTLPFISVLVRRAHDTGIDGSRLVSIPFVGIASYVLLVKLVPNQGFANIAGIGFLLLFLSGFLIVALAKSQPHENRFGAPPLHRPNPNEVPHD